MIVLGQGISEAAQPMWQVAANLLAVSLHKLETDFVRLRLALVQFLKTY